jgi:hypothetical protein
VIIDADSPPPSANYQVAIPSFRRPLLASQTVANLVACGVPPDVITLFLSDPTEGDEYRALIPHPTNIVVGRPGICANRNRINHHYRPGTRVVSIDDDTTTVPALAGKRLAPFTALHDFFTQAWDIAGCRLWGVNPTANPFYMNATPIVKHGLYFACGGLHGAVTDPTLPDLTLPVKEDYERTIHYYEADGVVARFDWLTVNTARAAGGVGVEREERNRAAADELVHRWPQYFTHRSPTEVRILRTRLTRQATT